MVRLVMSLVLGTLTVWGAVEMNNSASDDDRQQLWQQVEDAESKSLPKSAADALEKIYDSAVEDEEYPEAVRALAKKYFLEGRNNQPIAPYVIRKLASDMDSFPEQVRPVMKAILANWFFSYYQQNRWRFAQRSQTGQVPSEDFETWDLPRFLNEIDDLFTSALDSADALRQIPIGEYDKLISKGTIPDSHRPTLFDFVAYQALEFYSLDEQIIRQQGAFDLRADSPIFAPVDDFLAWKPQSEDEDSFLLNAVKILQQLLEFHADDQEPVARLDTDLHRLAFGSRAAVGSESSVRYRAALQRFADEHNQHPLSSVALARIASSLHSDNDYVEAHKIANQGQRRFPDSIGGKQCFNLVEQIEAQEVTIQAERVWNSSGPVVEVSYRNIEQVHFRLVKFDYTKHNWGNQRNPASMSQQERGRVLQQKPIREWTSTIPKTDDFKRRVESVEVDIDVPPGAYYLIASIRRGFGDDSNIVSLCEVWRSDLSVIMRNDYSAPNISGHVVDAVSGEPIANARVDVSAWVRDGRVSREKKLPSTTTDDSGFFAVLGENRKLHRVIVKHNEHVLAYIDQHYNSNNPRSFSRGDQLVFFTDRSIYRPGQTVQFKGTCIRFNQATNEYEVIPNRSVSVSLRDPNNQEIERQEFRSNQFGSISGSFVAPRNRGTGRMQLHVVGGPSGRTSVRVEEYKRPKFVVEIEKPEKAFRLQEKVSVVGRAKAYTGAPIDGAKVTWRVVRNVSFPDWWYWRCWWCPPTQGQAQEIANGELDTSVDGSFEIAFEAIPDLSVDREGDPVFTYSITADVTDTTGETRSDTQSVRVGYKSLQAKLKCDDWQTTDNPVKLSLNVSTLDGEGQQVDGVLKVYALKSPEKVQRARLSQPRNYSYTPNGGEAGRGKPDLSKINAWPLGELVSEQQVTTAGDGSYEADLQLQAGAFQAVFETADTSGLAVKSEIPIVVFDRNAKSFATLVPHYFEINDASVEVGETLEAFWGSGYQSGRAFVEFENRGKVFRSFWTKADETQASIRQEVSEELRGGFTMRLTFVRENRAYVETRRIDVPWSNKKLEIKWEHFVSKLQPGDRETWTAVISGPDAERVSAEMVATMYDASLDAYVKHNWRQGFGVFYQDRSSVSLLFQNSMLSLQPVIHNLSPKSKSVNWRYRHFTNEVPSIGSGYSYDRSSRIELLSRSGKFVRRGGRGGRGGGMVGESFGMSNGVVGDFALEAAAQPASVRFQKGKDESDESAVEPAVDLSKVAARKNLQETAFFFPNLSVDDDGKVRIEFEMPEALTEWKFLGFAHDTELKTALLTGTAVTSKDLMVQPNPPRFLREGDQLEFSVKVSNQSATQQAGKVRLSFADARDQTNMDEQLGNVELDKSFDIPAGESRSLFWKLTVPDYVGVLTYKAVGGTERVSDGEEGMLPVLSKRILVTESLPLPMRGNQTRDFQFERLQNSGKSDSLQSQSLTVQMTSNPSWYAVMALPYLMEYPHQCSEQVFNRMYANVLGQHIVASDPRISQIFEQWRGTDALDSPLEKNDDIRNVLIAESPWLRAAKKESKARRDVGILFEENRLRVETKNALDRLKQMQYSDGAWPWFPGGRANDFITLYVTTGFGRLRHLGIKNIDVSPAVKALDRLDHWIHQKYVRILEKSEKDKNHLSPTICLYLYGRSFFLNDAAVNPKYKPAVDYFLGQAKQYWPKVGNRMSQGQLAVGLKRFGDQATPREIMASLTERSQASDELGMFWLDGDASWWWYRAPIETQAMMVEAYDEILGDQKKVEECKIWLLKQKQTQNWKTTKSTADAVYGLLLRGKNLLASDQLVQVSLGGAELKPVDVEAGTGFYQQRFVRGEIKPEMGQINVVKKDDGIAWGSIHWQYLEDVSKIEPYEGTPLTLKKGLYIKKNTKTGPVIEPVSGPVKVGDQLVTRVELRVDRDIEYIHLKDYRGSGTEPVNVLSRYKYQDGLAYYESTRDTASHFFIDYLPRGTYVFEYSVRVQHRGKYETGIAELQCMYAPEFNSHSGSVAIEVN